MAENRESRDPSQGTEMRRTSDSERVAERERQAAELLFEINYLADKLGVSKEEVRNAMARVGADEQTLEEYFRSDRRTQ